MIYTYGDTLCSYGTSAIAYNGGSVILYPSAQPLTLTSNAPAILAYTPEKPDIKTWLDILEQYKKLLITQYRIKPKARATIGVLTDCSVCEGIPLQLKTAFILDTVYGNQLTVLGKIVGIPRNIIGLDLEHSFFSFTRYFGSPASVGFGRYSFQPDADIFLRYNEEASYTMTDFELKAVIKLRILYNTRFATFKAIKEGLWNYFQGDIDIVTMDDMLDIWFNFTRYNGTPASHGFGRYTDSPYDDGYYFYRYWDYKNMEINYKVKTIYQNAFESALYLNIVPCSMGVAINTSYV